MNLVVAITGASGAVYAQRFLQSCVTAGVNVHLIVSPYGQRLLYDELGLPSIDLAALAGRKKHTITLYNYKDQGALPASGSFLHEGMIVMPCSSKSLSEIATGVGDHLIGRAATVCLKERRKLVLVHREMPLSPIDVNHYKTLTDAGAIIAPANPGLYLNPQSVEEIVDFVAGKCLDLFQIPHKLKNRWDPKVKRQPMKLSRLN